VEQLAIGVRIAVLRRPHQPAEIVGASGSWHFRRHVLASLSVYGTEPARLAGYGRAAKEFVSAHPPTRPCIAEYGEAFPGFLASRPAASRVPVGLLNTARSSSR
jgi:hypothetical protein